MYMNFITKGNKWHIHVHVHGQCTIQKLDLHRRIPCVLAGTFDVTVSYSSNVVGLFFYNGRRIQDVILNTCALYVVP